MKRFRLYLVCLTVSLTMLSCGQKMLVEQTSEQFVDAVLSGDEVAVRRLVTPETAQAWGIQAELIDLALDPEAQKQIKLVKERVCDVVIDGDNAWTLLKIKIPSGEKMLDVLHLKKYGKMWLIHEPGIFVKNVLVGEEIIAEN